MPLPFWYNLPTMFGYLLVVAMCCLTTAVTALFCSTIFQKSATSLISTYVIIMALFMAPIAITFFTGTFLNRSSGTEFANAVGVFSPFAATFALPLDIERDGSNVAATGGDLGVFFGYLGWSILYNGGLVLLMMRLFEVRWRVAD
jgi:hypothetical protein